MGLFSGASKQEKRQEAMTWDRLGGITSSSLDSAKDLGRSGRENTERASTLFKGIASGDRTALSPAVNAAAEVGDAQKRERAQMGTARGGGVAGENQQIQDHTRQLISSLLGEAQIDAGDKLAAIGSGETNQMMSALGVASGTETNLSSLLHQDIKEKNQSAAKAWSSLISGGLNFLTGGGFGAVKGLIGGTPKFNPE